MNLKLWLELYETKYGNDALIAEITEYLDGKNVEQNIYELIDVNPMELYAD